MAEANWEVLDGTSDMDLLLLPFDRFCNRVWAWAKSVIHPREWDSWKFKMELPPVGEQPKTGPWSDEAIAATFQERPRG